MWAKLDDELLEAKPIGVQCRSRRLPCQGRRSFDLCVCFLLGFSSLCLPNPIEDSRERQSECVWGGLSLGVSVCISGYP